MTQSLPVQGVTSGNWGTLLNNWLLVAHNADGTLINPGVAWINITSETWGADPTGATDCTAIIQAALNHIAALPNGGVLYFPAGSYLQNGAVTWNDASPLTICGDGPQASSILLNNSSSNIIYWSITNAARVTVREIALINNAYSPAFSDTNVGILCTSCPWGAFYNVAMQGGTTRMNQCVVLNNCTNFDFDVCDLRSYVNSLVLEGTTAAVAYRAGSFAQNAGSGVPTAASILMTGSSATLHVSGVYFNSGDRGLLCNGGDFIWLYDAELNNMSIDGLVFNTGTQVWAESCWIAADSAVQCNSSVVFGNSYVGCAYFTKCVFAGAINHNVVLGSGVGYGFTDCIFGDLGAGKQTANTYDELNIQNSVSMVTVHGCHFNTDPNFGIGTVKPRAAVYCNTGARNIQVYGNVSPSDASYGTSALVATSSNYAAQSVNMPTIAGD